MVGFVVGLVGLLVGLTVPLVGTLCGFILGLRVTLVTVGFELGLGLGRVEMVTLDVVGLCVVLEVDIFCVDLGVVILVGFELPFVVSEFSTDWNVESLSDSVVVSIGLVALFALVFFSVVNGVTVEFKVVSRSVVVCCFEFDIRGMVVFVVLDSGILVSEIVVTTSGFVTFDNV